MFKEKPEMRLIYIKLDYLLRFVLVFSFVYFNIMVARAEEYATGISNLKFEQGVLTISVGHVNHFNDHDFYVYSFLFQPKGSNEWNQVPRIEKIDDPKMLFTVQTKHSADTQFFDAKIIDDKKKIQLITASMETGETLADKGPITVTSYTLVKLDDYERWVFLRTNIKKIESNLTIEQILKNTK
jgi:hypothetical protein